MPASWGERPVTYLVDRQQNVLVPFLPPGRSPGDDHIEQQPVDSTLAGRVYQQGQPLTHPVRTGADDLERDDGALALRSRLFGAMAAEMQWSLL